MGKGEKPEGKKVPSTTEAILESISEGVFTVGLDWRVTSFNRAAEQITGVSRKDALGRLCSEVFRSSMCEAECPLRETLKTKRAIIAKAGYIVDADGNRIPVSVSTAVLKDGGGSIIGGAETFRDLSEVEALRHELEGKFSVGDLVSRSPLMQRVFEILPAVASSPSTVLILGETGTGKEVVARTIHSLSPRNSGPFVAVNCGALPETLLESELFGYKAGAFTGAGRDRAGRFRQAEGGTIFLDEIGEMSPASQVRLLRVLQEKTYEPLGARRPEKTDARVIVATNRNLKEAVENGTFREDLYYRVNVIRIELPPLRRRKEDIPLLVEHFIDHFNRLQGKSISEISAEALSLLNAHDWPGNVRELENSIERAFVLCDRGLLGIEHLPEELVVGSTMKRDSTGLKSVHDTVETQAIRRALENNGYNRLAAAKELGIHKSTLFRKMKRLGLKVPKRSGRSPQEP